MPYQIRDTWKRLPLAQRYLKLPCPLIGLSGGIATGKSEVSTWLSKRGHPLIDADKLVKKVYHHPETLSEISKKFGSEALVQGSPNFPFLRQMAFGHKDNKAWLEELILKQLPPLFLSEFQKIKDASYLFYDAPTLFERGLHLACDLTLCTYAPRSLQLERLLRRDGISEKLANSILDQQLDIEQKRALADLTIPNISSLEKLHGELVELEAKLFTSKLPC